MTTSVKIINFGPRAVTVSVVEKRGEGAVQLAQQIETLYHCGVSEEICVYAGTSVLVEEVPDVKPHLSADELDALRIKQARAKLMSGDLLAS